MRRLLARFRSMATTTATSSTLFEVPSIRVAPRQLQQQRQVLPHRHAARPQAVEARLPAAQIQQQAVEAHLPLRPAQHQQALAPPQVLL